MNQSNPELQYSFKEKQVLDILDECVSMHPQGLARENLKYRFLHPNMMGTMTLDDDETSMLTIGWIGRNETHELGVGMDKWGFSMINSLRVHSVFRDDDGQCTMFKHYFNGLHVPEAYDGQVLFEGQKLRIRNNSAVKGSYVHDIYRGKFELHKSLGYNEYQQALTAYDDLVDRLKIE